MKNNIFAMSGNQIKLSTTKYTKNRSFIQKMRSRKNVYPTDHRKIKSKLESALSHKTVRYSLIVGFN